MHAPGIALLAALALWVGACPIAGADQPHAFDLVPVPGGVFFMGDAVGDASEVPVQVTVAPFLLMRHEVSNAQFQAFVEATGHVTDAERSAGGYVWSGRWRQVPGADWRHPAGPGSTIIGLDRHPVVQVSVNDARSFCTRYGMRLPTEAEWELAARGLQDLRRYPWGDAPPESPDGERLANFGAVACCAADAADGYRRTAPVGSYPRGASPFGILDLAGNVWEWTATPFADHPRWTALRGGGWGNDPYCLRVSYRHGNPPDIGLDMVGIRCARDARP